MRERHVVSVVHTGMNRIAILFGLTLVFGAIAYALGHYMDVHGIRTAADSKVVAQEKIENRELSAVPR
jgi:hypothetical protein